MIDGDREWWRRFSMVKENGVFGVVRLGYMGWVAAVFIRFIRI